jgi:predicted nucleotidyltransferase
VAVTPQELARTLVRRHARDRQAEAIRAEDLRARIRGIVAELLACGAIRRAWLVGSLAWGGFGRRSDVDLVVEGLALEEAPALWDRLTAELAARVDLLRLESLPPRFAERVVKDGEPLHVA